jgi:hypothetical protein
VLRDALRQSGMPESRVMLRDVHFGGAGRHRRADGPHADAFCRRAGRRVKVSRPQSKRATRDPARGSLIASLTAPWAPERYEDTYVRNLMQVINSKLKRKASSEVAGQENAR